MLIGVAILLVSNFSRAIWLVLITNKSTDG